MDALSSVLDIIAMKGGVYFNCFLAGRWGMELQAKQLAEFHIVSRGQCWLRMYDRAADLQLQTGDIVFFPHGHAHAMLSHPDSPMQNATAFLKHAMPEFGPLVIGTAEEAQTELLCGYFDFQNCPNHLFLSALPSLIHIKNPADQELCWLTQIIAMLGYETSNQLQGRTAIVQHLVEVMFAHLIRAYVRQNNSDACILKAMADQRIGKCLNAIHQDIATAWTIEQLAQISGMSRTAFISRFQQLSGFNPGDYLTQLRMLKAQRLLPSSDSGLVDIALQVGYQSEAAFSKAFKRFAGISPGAYKKHQRQML
jgi:AraC-like DNA-binding protein